MDWIDLSCEGEDFLRNRKKGNFMSSLCLVLYTYPFGICIFGAAFDIIFYPFASRDFQGMDRCMGRTRDGN